MKNLITLAALVAACAGPANAHVVLVGDNAAGGIVQLTDQRCAKPPSKPRANWHVARSTNRNGKVVLTGCWAVEDVTGDVLMHWRSGERVRAAWSKFELTPYARRRYVTDMELEHLFGAI